MPYCISFSMEIKYVSNKLNTFNSNLINEICHDNTQVISLWFLTKIKRVVLLHLKFFTDLNLLSLRKENAKLAEYIVQKYLGRYSCVCASRISNICIIISYQFKSLFFCS